MKRLALVLAALLCSLQAAAQSWPAKPVRIVVPLGAGGFADVPARLLAPHLAAQLNGTFFVENRPGAGSTIGADHVAKAEADGHRSEGSLARAFITTASTSGETPGCRSTSCTGRTVSIWLMSVTRLPASNGRTPQSIS